MRNSLIALTAMIALVPLTVQPAAADTKGCVTGAEFRKIEKGFKKPRVHDIFDTRGVLFTLQPKTMERWYVACSTDALDVQVWYRKREGDWRVTAKNR